MIKRLLILFVLLMPLTVFAGQIITVNDLIGTWEIEDSNEKYSFKSDGNVLYIVGNSSREYSFKLVGKEIIIQREMGITLNRLIEKFDGNNMMLIDKDFGIEFLLKKIN